MLSFLVPCLSAACEGIELAFGSVLGDWKGMDRRGRGDGDGGGRYGPLSLGEYPSLGSA